MADAFDILHSRIAQLLGRRERVLAAIDGMAASGKTTLCERLRSAIPGCYIVHMDDFTLPFEQRGDGYFDRLLSNADTQRFTAEVLDPLGRGEDAVYRPYRCHPDPGFLAPVTIPAGARCVIVEGAYCLHPQLFHRYDLRVLMTVSPDTQRARILARNGADGLRSFEARWIPMENRHIASRRLAEKCDLLLRGD